MQTASFVPLETITGTVERVTFFNEETGYAVLKIRPEGRYPRAVARDGTLAVVGSMPRLGSGERAQFTGAWVEDARYGTQFRAERVTPLAPTTEEGIIAFLSSGLVRGIGPRSAEKIVAKFGARTIEILDNDPQRIHEVGLKKELANQLITAWSANQHARAALVFLQGYGITSRMAARIYDHYGSATVARVRDNPYTLADDVYGIGFVKADEIARAMGIPADSPERIASGLQFALTQLSREGHTYAPRAELIAKAAELLRIENTTRIEDVLTQQLFIGSMITEEDASAGISADAVYLPPYYYAERDAANRLRMLANTPSPVQAVAAKTNWSKFLSSLTRDQNISLSEQQQGAVRATLSDKITVLTGGPGTGKTTTLRMVIHALEALEFSFALASPTGRAARRLSEATDRPASTLHRLLGYSPAEGGFTHDEDSPLECDVLIIDESSMIDLLLFQDVLKALNPHSHLMLVGDVDQLPSVGAGSVLQDVIGSGLAHVTRLQAIFRQREDSHIVLNAHRINGGDLPLMDNRSADFFFFGEDDPAATLDLIVDIVRRRLPEKFGIDPLRDVQVIAPMYRGPAGIHALNEALQRTLNAEGSNRAEKKLAGRIFRFGDKVMQTRNNYDKEVFNGDIGYISGIDFEDGSLEVNFEGSYAYYDWTEAEELIHAFCISTHRSQGSEYPIIVMPVLTQQYMMLQRNLLYTAITRAKRTVVLVGSRKAVAMAVHNDKVSQRYSGLLARLQHG
jgi:exodeoxyribonuclease V alpha subunit